MYEELVLQHNINKAVELQTRLAERLKLGLSWICLIQEPYVVRGNVCGLGSASRTRHIEC